MFKDSYNKCNLGDLFREGGGLIDLKYTQKRTKGEGEIQFRKREFQNNKMFIKSV